MTEPSVSSAIARIDRVVDSFGGYSAELLDFASGIVDYINQSFPDASDSVRFRVAVYAYDLQAAVAASTDRSQDYSTAAGYAVAAWRLARALRG